MKLSSSALPLLASFASLAIVACASEPVESKGGAAEDDSITSSAKIVDEIAPTATITGTFDPKLRVYGYVIPVKAGATITAKLTAKAGAGAQRDDASAPLDTVLAVSAPYESVKKRGVTVAESDDGTDVAAPPVQFKADRDQKFFLSFSSWEDTGAGSYELSLTCEGTDFQCQRPSFDKPCEAGSGPLYVQGASIEGNVEWNRCEVVLLEQSVLKAGATLTVKPGVTVKGNYVAFPQDQNNRFGFVGLTIEGLLQVAGTPEHPVAFTSLKGDRGWGGLTFKSKGNSMRNVVVERANVAVDIQTEGSVDVVDSYLQGVTIDDQQSIAGIRAGGEVSATFQRAVVKGFQDGLHLNQARHFEITDAVIKENGNGVRVDGTGGATTSCGSPPAVTTWRDPVITHSDIVDNRAYGIVIAGNDALVQVSLSNLIGNGLTALEVQGLSVAPASFFKQNNIFGNGATTARDNIDLRTYHRRGTLNVEGNYWKDISDPELSGNWARPCGNNSPLSFTGFAPMPVPGAGPRPEVLTPRVKDECVDAAAR